MMTASNNLQVLRAATRISHVRLDELFSGFDLGDAAGYSRFLEAHASALLPTEAALDRTELPLQLPDWPERRRGHAIRADLIDLDITAPSLLPAPLFERPGAAWGAAYVLEGSRLGGTVLSRRLAPGMPSRYLRSGQSKGAWPDFLKRLDSALQDPPLLDAAVVAAVATFALFETAGRQALGAPHP